MAKNTSWISGQHAVDSVMKTNPERIIGLYLAHSDSTRHVEIEAVAKNLGIPVQRLDKTDLMRRCGSERHQGVAVEVKARKELNERDLLSLVEQRSEASDLLILVLDQIQDPHNLGACLRTADAAGVDAVVVPKDNSSPMTPVVHKVASGAAETVPLFRVTNLARSLTVLKEAGIWVMGTSDKAQASLYQTDLTGNLAIVMGTEGKGMRKRTETLCDILVSLPMAGTIVTSLNVSVATGVCLYEAVRQRTQN